MTTSSGGKKGYVDGREPTMEEILGSIRRIIAEDGAPAPAARVETPAVEPVRELDQAGVDTIVEAPPAESAAESAAERPGPDEAVASHTTPLVAGDSVPAEPELSPAAAEVLIGGLDGACCGCGGCYEVKDGPIDFPSFLFPDPSPEERPAGEEDLDVVPPAPTNPEPEADRTPKPPKPDEPSMEEILASIRRIISEDGEPGTPPKPKLDLPTRAIVLSTTHEVNTQVWPSCFECRWFNAEQSMDPCRHSHAKPWTSLERKLVGIGLKAFRPAVCPLRPDKPVLGD